MNQLQNLNHFPTTLPNLESLGLTSDSLLSLYGLPSSLPQLINISITSDSLRTLYGLPSSLPALEQISLTLTSPHLGDIFTAFPKSLPNLKKIRIIAPALATLDGFPVDVPLLTELTLRGTFPTRGSLGYQDENMTQISSFKGMPLDLPALHYFQFYSASMKKIAGIPQFMPQLQQIRLHCPHLRVLEGFPTSLPLLTAFNLECHHLRSLHGYPTDAPRLKAFHCQENKLTRIDVDLARHPWMTYVYFQGNPLKSLHGFPYRFLFRMESFFSQMVHLRNGVEGRYQPPFQFSPRGMEFILAWLNSPLQAGERTLKAFSLKGDDYESMKDSFRTSHFTTEESCQALFAFYEKSPLALAQQYVHSRQYGLHDGPPAEPLTEDEYGRLLYEVEDPEIAYLRSHLPEEDRVIRSFETF